MNNCGLEGLSFQCFSLARNQVWALLWLGGLQSAGGFHTSVCYEVIFTLGYQVFGNPGHQQRPLADWAIIHTKLDSSCSIRQLLQHTCSSFTYPYDHISRSLQVFIGFLIFSSTRHLPSSNVARSGIGSKTNNRS